MTQDRPDTHEGHDLEGRLDTMKRELDALQIHVMKDKARWYMQVPVVVSLLVSAAALFFSFWTDSKSEDRLENQKRHEARVELRGVIQRLQTLPREDIEIIRKYASEPTVQSNARAFLNTETQVLARQAEELIEELEGDVTATDYYAVVGAFASSGQPTADLEKLIAGGLAVAKDAWSAATLYRYLAQARFSAGDPVNGRAAYAQAFNVFKRFPEKNRNVVIGLQATTQQLWAAAELGVGECDAAWGHITYAQGYRVYPEQIAETAKRIEAQCGPNDAS